MEILKMLMKLQENFNYGEWIDKRVPRRIKYGIKDIR